MSINKTTDELNIDKALNETTDELNIDEALNETTDELSINETLNKMSKEDTLKNPDEVFTDDFEIRYEGDFPNFPEPKDDNYKDVLASLSELDNTHKIDYLEENYTASFDIDENSSPIKEDNTAQPENSRAAVLKAAAIILILAAAGIVFSLLGKYL